jgi:hypothetical protein
MCTIEFVLAGYNNYIYSIFIMRMLRITIDSIYSVFTHEGLASALLLLLLFLKSRQSLKGIKSWGCQNVLGSAVYVLLGTNTALRLSQIILVTPKFYAL